MKSYFNEDGLLVLEQVFNPIVFKTNDGEKLSVAMRDSGFEMNYDTNKTAKFIEMKDGVVSNDTSVTEAMRIVSRELVKDEVMLDAWRTSISFAVMRSINSYAKHLAVNLPHHFDVGQVAKDAADDFLNTMTLAAKREKKVQMGKMVNYEEYPTTPEEAFPNMDDLNDDIRVGKDSETIFTTVLPEKERILTTTQVADTEPQSTPLESLNQEELRSIYIGAYYKLVSKNKFDYREALELSTDLMSETLKLKFTKDLPEVIIKIAKRHEFNQQEQLMMVDYIMTNISKLIEDIENDKEPEDTREAENQTQDDNPVDPLTELINAYKQYKDLELIDLTKLFPSIPEQVKSHPCEGCSNYARMLNGETVVCHCTIPYHTTTGYWNVQDNSQDIEWMKPKVYTLYSDATHIK